MQSLYTTLPLKAIRNNRPHMIYLVMLEENGERYPVELGTGRNAFVFLGSSTEDLTDEFLEYYAIKFVKNDLDSQYARVSEERFFTEGSNTRSFGQLSPTFVKFNCWGGILPRRLAEPSRYWVNKFGDLIEKEINTGDAYLNILETYDLQGPFYALELCQATLYDLLDSDTAWMDLHVYHLQPPRARSLPTYRDAFNKTAQSMQDSIAKVSSLYTTNDFNGKSGYDILNAFTCDSESNRVRNYAVLELFKRIVQVVQDLHSHPDKLVHRDLKPGNVFLTHGAGFDGIGAIALKLGDLGYTAAEGQLNDPNFTLADGPHNPSALAPGSQFYRAPEQAELPVEVRVSFSKNAPRRVNVQSSKISNIHVGDRLVLSDRVKRTTRSPSRATNERDKVVAIFQINRVERDAKGNITGFVLNKDLTIDKTSDVVAHVVRATGFHTDGYSLGAILYDLASGGRNPELFYTYCLVRFIEEFSGTHYTIDDIVEALSPEFSVLGNIARPAHEPFASNESRPLKSFAPADLPPLRPRPAGPKWKQRQPSTIDGLSKGERLLMAGLVLGASSADELVGRILHSSLDQKIETLRSHEREPSNKLSITEKWELLRLVMDASDIRELLDLMFTSSLEQRIVPEQTFLSQDLTLPERWALLQTTISAETVEDLVNRILGSSLNQKVAQVPEPADQGVITLAEKWSVLKLVMGAERVADLVDYLLTSPLDQRVKMDPSAQATPDATMSMGKRWEYLKVIMTAQDLDGMVNDLLKCALSGGYQQNEERIVRERLLNYRFRNFHIVSELLTDKRGEPIPADIIRIIVKCMLRNVRGGRDSSYYASEVETGFLTPRNISAIRRIFQDTDALLADTKNQLPDGFPDELKENLLFKLRSMVPAPPLAVADPNPTPANGTTIALPPANGTLSDAALVDPDETQIGQGTGDWGLGARHRGLGA